MSRLPWVGIVGCLLVSVACGEGEKGSVVSFGSSACKKEEPAKRLARLRSLRAIPSEAGLDGLTCVGWQRTDAGLILDLYNFEGACGARWTGDGALAADGTLEVRIDNPGCTIAACGTCLYDWSFELSARLPEQAVPLAVVVSACPGEQESRRVTAALGAEASGLACTQASYGALTWQAAAHGTCGQTGMPCEGSLLCGSGSVSTTGTCADGLACDNSVVATEPVCRVPCATVADCPRSDVYACDAGLCKPTSVGW